MAEDLSPFLIIQGLKTECIGREIAYYPSLPSTMDAARDKARAGVLEGTVIIAGEQTAGRGRLKRSWLSPKGNIALSIIIHPDIATLPYLIMVASLAVVQSIESVTGQKTRIKWPNDILIGGKKVCGILIENELKGNKAAYSIIGIGINTNLNTAEHDEIARTATSLKNPADADLRLKLVISLLTEFEKLYVQLPNGKDIFKAWRDKLATLGKRVKATWGDQIIEGVAQDVDESGALLVRGNDGEVTKVVGGDVTLRE
jgi:BirA family transcriptional regulator, biotin operon repressor / biotin---[acetyl-CoA-carboxylase] ligase